jgi:thioredoxin reductase (NADPH)
MNVYDIIIIGGGPAGLTAAIYAGRANKKTLIIEKSTFGGQITSSPKVENIPGFLSVTGNEFAEQLIGQATNLDTEIEVTAAEKIIPGKPHKVICEDGEFEGKTVIIATGTKHRLLGLEGEEELIGNGISFCAVCDGAFYEGKTVGVVGGGNSALQEALLLSETSSKVYVIQNLDFLTGEDKLQELVNKKDNIEVILGSTVNSYIADSEFKGVNILSKDGEKELLLDGLFIAVGLIPQNEDFADVISLDDRGYVDASENCLTNIEGIFVAGDCRKKQIRQVATAAADGAVAALAACEYLR